MTFANLTMRGGFDKDMKFVDLTTYVVMLEMGF